MRDPLLVLLPAVIAATRSLASGIQSPKRRGLRSAISAETECQFLLVMIFCLTGLLVSLYAVTRFPDLGLAIAEMNQF
jgi:hypothetical protein